MLYNKMNIGLLLNYTFFTHRFRSFKIFNSNGCESRLDAGSVLFERERRTFSQYYYAECVHSYFPRRLRSIQYTVNETEINTETRANTGRVYYMHVLLYIPGYPSRYRAR